MSSAEETVASSGIVYELLLPLSLSHVSSFKKWDYYYYYYFWTETPSGK